jgi:hypothetical protein
VAITALPDLDESQNFETFRSKDSGRGISRSGEVGEVGEVEEVGGATSRVGFNLPLSSVGLRDLRIHLPDITLERTAVCLWTVSVWRGEH